MTKNSLLVAVDTRPAGDRPDSVVVEFRVLPTISDRAHRLLGRADGCEVEFRKSISDLHSDDLVGFANSKTGGAILIGVDSAWDRESPRRAATPGYAIGDGERRRILAVARQCVPFPPISIFVEDGADRPFYRIEIASGPCKPYCTAEGVYTIRNAGRIEPLYPPQLLALCLGADAGETLRRFEQAPLSVASAMDAVALRAATERKLRTPSLWGQWSATGKALGRPADTAAHEESDAGGFPEGAADCAVRLSSQDLCGFLMRLT